MSFKTYDDYINNYDSFTKKFDYGYDISPDVSKELVNHYRDTYLRERGSGEHVTPDSSRSFLTRAFDTLLMPNYAVAGFVDGFADGKGGRTPIQGLWEGVKAGNPFGKGFEDGRTTFSDVLETSGWKPESMAGKFAKGATGFALDVAFDPTTYLTGGGSAIVKGTGRVGAKATVGKAAEEYGTKKFESVLLEERMKKHGNTHYAVSNDMVNKATSAEGKILSESSEYMSESLAREVIEEQAKKHGIQKTERELLHESEEFARRYNDVLGIQNHNKEMRLTWGIGNMPFAPKGLQDKVIDLGSMENVARFSDKLGLSKPYEKLRRTIYGGQIGKLLSNKSTLYKMANDSPEQFWTALEYQSRTRGMKMDKLSEEKAISGFFKEMDLNPQVNKEVRELLQDKTVFNKVMQNVRVIDSNKLKGIKDVFTKAKDDTSEQLDSLLAKRDFANKWSGAVDEKLLSESGELRNIQNEYKAELATLDLSFTKNREELVEVVDSLGRELRYLEEPLSDSSAILQLYNSSRKERDAFSDHMSSKMELPDSSELKINKDSMDNVIADGVLGKMDSSVSREASQELERALSKHIFGEEGALSNTSDSAIDKLVSMVRDGSNPSDMQVFIDQNPHMFSPHMRDVNEFVAQELGYRQWHGDGFKEPLAKMLGRDAEQAKLFTTDDLLKEVSKLFSNGELNPKHELEFSKLLQLEYKRDIMRREYATMTPSEFAHYRSKKMDEELMEWYNSGLDDSLMEGRRHSWSDNDYASEQRKQRTSGDSEYMYEVDVMKKLSGDDHGVVIDDLIRNGLVSPHAIESAGNTFIHFLDRVVDNVNALSETMFKVSYDKMSDAQRKYALSLATSNVRDRGAQNIDPRMIEETRLRAERRMAEEAEQIKDRLGIDEDLSPKEIFERSTVTQSEIGRKQELLDEIKQTQHKLSELPSVAGRARQGVVEDFERRISNQERLITSLESKQKDYRHALSESGDAEVERLSNVIKRQEGLLNNEEALVSYLGSKNRSDIALIRDKERYSKNVTEVHSFKDGRLASTNSDGQILIKKGITTDEIVNHLKGGADNDISRQKAMVFDELGARGWGEERIREVVSDPEKAKRLIIEHEISHNVNRDMERYWENGRDMFTPDKIEIETRATVDALEMLEKYNTEQFKRNAQVDSGRVVLDNMPVAEESKQLAKELRERFMEMGQREAGIGKLSKEQLEANLMDYLPRIPTPEGEAFFRSMKDLQPGGDGGNVTRELGYGMTFNPHERSRTTSGTVEEVNKYFQEEFSELLKGKNVFSENLADIYMARAMKHVEVMYDDKYMREMLDVFGKDIGPDGVVEDGYRAVMNYGMMKKSVEDYTSMSLSMRISGDITDFLEQNSGALRDMAMKSGVDPNKLISESVNNYIDKTYTDDVIQKLVGEFRESIVERAGLPENILGREALPMQELSPEQARSLQSVWADTEQSYRSSLEHSMNKAVQREDMSRIEDLGKRFDKLNQYTPPQVKQVNDAIVGMANQARQLQVAKDQSQFLRMYDKFTHFMKVNQTVVVPAYHTRNKLSNIFNNWLAIGQDAINKDWHVATTALSRYEGDSARIAKAIEDGGFGHKQLSKNIKVDKVHPELEDYLSGGELRWSDLYELSLRYDVIDTGQFARDIGAGSASSGLFKNLKRTRKDGTSMSLDPTDTSEFIGYKVGTEVGVTVENSDRMIHFASMLKQGKSPLEAAESSKKYLFDYSDVTAFEQNVMKRIFPYYTWMRKNARLQMGELVDNPGKYRDLAKSITNIEKMTPADERMDEVYMDSWTEGWIKTPFSKRRGKDEYDEDGNLVKEAKSIPMLLSANLPYMDLARLPDPTRIDKSIRELIAQSATQIKAPLEMGLNHNFFFNSDIAGENDSKAGKYAGYLASQFGLANVASSLAKSDSPSDLALRTSNALTGAKLSAYDYDSSRASKIDRLRQGYVEDPIDTAIDKLMGGALGKVKHVALRGLDGVNDLVGQTPKSPDEYDGALRPISVEKYNNLSDKEKSLYEAPSKDEANVYHKKAVEMSEKAYEESGKLKKFTWTLLDTARELINPSETEAKMGHVTRVIDGDTFKVKIGSEEESVRLLLIDTPETQGDVFSMFPMPYGEEATQFAEEKTLGKDVKLHITPDRDVYGRVLAYVELEDGTDFNKAQVEQGNAKVKYTQNMNTGNRYGRTDEYFDAQIDAHDEGRGLWDVPGGYGGSPYEDDGLYINALMRRLSLGGD